jgi:hypothetical protein
MDLQGKDKRSNSKERFARVVTSDLKKTHFLKKQNLNFFRLKKVEHFLNNKRRHKDGGEKRSAKKRLLSKKSLDGSLNVTLVSNGE